MTMGIVEVASLAKRVAVGPSVTIRLTFKRTSSAASAGRDRHLCPHIGHPAKPCEQQVATSNCTPAGSTRRASVTAQRNISVASSGRSRLFRTLVRRPKKSDRRAGPSASVTSGQHCLNKSRVISVDIPSAATPAICAHESGHFCSLLSAARSSV